MHATHAQVHFQILAIFGAYLVASLALTDAATLAATAAAPSVESCVLFGLLTGTYTLVLSFALDLNQPYVGVYQVP